MRACEGVSKIIGAGLLVAGTAYLILAVPGLLSAREAVVIVGHSGETWP